MGPTSGVPLPARTAAGKAVGKVTNAEGADAPARRNGRQWLEHESTLDQPGMRNGQPPRAESAPGPQHDIEVEDARSPAFPAAAAEFPLDGLEPNEHAGRLDVTLDDCDRVGEIAARAAVRRVEDNRRGIEQAELLVQPGNCRLDHARGTPEPPVRPVRTECDRVEVRRFCQQQPFVPSLSRDCLSSAALRIRTALRQAQGERYWKACASPPPPS